MVPLRFPSPRLALLTSLNGLSAGTTVHTTQYIVYQDEPNSADGAVSLRLESLRLALLTWRNGLTVLCIVPFAVSREGIY